jgi:hypothetical protein
MVRSAPAGPDSMMSHLVSTASSRARLGPARQELTVQYLAEAGGG